MNVFIKKAVIAAAASVSVLAAGIIAHADSWDATLVDVDYDSNIVTVSGILPIKTEADISVMILNPNYTAADLTDKSFGEVVNYQDQIKSAADGSFSFSYKQSGDTGRYKVIMSIKSYNITDNEHSFLATSSQSEILGAINNAKTENSVTNMETALRNAMESMTLNCDDYDKFIAEGGSNAEVCAMLVRSAQVNSIASLKAQINNSVMLVRFNNASADDVEGLIDYYAEYTGIKNGTAYTTYKEKSNDEVKKAVAAAFVNKEFDVDTDMGSFFAETAIIQAVNEAVSRSSYGDIKTILTDNAQTVGIDISSCESLKYPDNVYKSLLASTYKTLEELKNAFNNAVTAQRNNEKDGGGSTGGSSSTSGGSSGGGSSSGGGGGSSSLGYVPAVKPVSNTVVFNDMANVSWAETAVNDLYNRGVVNGRGDNSFDPQGNVTREEFAKMLALAIGVAAPQESEITFTDVKEGEWYYSPIIGLADKEIINGVGDGLFGVGTNITREDMAVMIYRAMQYSGIDVNTSSKSDFSDYKSVSEYAKSAVSYLQSAGVVSGMNDGTFAPKNKVTRAQAAVIIYNMLVFCGI